MPRALATKSIKKSNTKSTVRAKYTTEHTVRRRSKRLQQQAKNESADPNENNKDSTPTSTEPPMIVNMVTLPDGPWLRDEDVPTTPCNSPTHASPDFHY